MEKRIILTNGGTMGFFLYARNKFVGFEKHEVFANKPKKSNIYHSKDGVNWYSIIQDAEVNGVNVSFINHDKKVLMHDGELFNPSVKSSGVNRYGYKGKHNKDKKDGD